MIKYSRRHNLKIITKFLIIQFAFFLLIFNGRVYSQSESFEESKIQSLPPINGGLLLGWDFDKHLNFGLIAKQNFTRNFGISSSFKFNVHSNDTIPADSAIFAFLTTYYYDRYSLLSLYLFYDIFNNNKLKIGVEAGYSYIWHKYHTAKFVRREPGGLFSRSKNIYEREVLRHRAHGYAFKGRVSFPILSEVNLELSYFYNEMHIKIHGIELAIISNISKK